MGHLLHIVMKLVQGTKVPIYPVIVAMTSNNRRHLHHRFRYWPYHSGSQPCLYRLPLCFQLLLAGAYPKAVLSLSGLCIEERESKKVKLIPCTLESSYWQYSRLVLRYFQCKLAEPSLEYFKYISRLVFILEQNQEVICKTYLVRLSP